MGDKFPSLKARQLLKALEGIGYRVVAQTGSHRKLEADGRPQINFAWHDKATIAPGQVRRLLVTTIGLTEEEAHDCI